jgi:hypothetical protein
MAAEVKIVPSGIIVTFVSANSNALLWSGDQRNFIARSAFQDKQPFSANWTRRIFLT